MLVSGLSLLEKATRDGNAIGSFSTYNLEITRAILSAAEAQGSAVFLAVGSSALDAGGHAPLSRLAIAAAESARVPVAVHLDHASDLELCRSCTEAGFTSLMIDGSQLPLADNIALTRRVVDLDRAIAVEGELGGIAGDEDVSGDQSTQIPMTDPEQAARFVGQSGVASLAVAIGNAHGFYQGEPRLDFDRLAAIRARVSVPLVLHGASGLSDDDLRRSISLGVRKVNVNTEIRHALFGALERSLRDGVAGYDLARLFDPAIEAMRETVEAKICVFRGD
jgi:ketose-bisphosphate aldolase